MKKLTALVLALMLVFCATFAMAADSKTAEDQQQATVQTPTYNAPAAEEEPAEEEEEEEPAVTAEVTTPAEDSAAAEVVEELAKPSTKPAVFFPAALNVSNTATVADVVNLAVNNYEPEMGDVVLNTQLETAFEQDDDVRVLVGLVNEDGEIEWVEAEEVTVNEDGTLNVKLSSDQMVKVQDAAEAILVVLTEGEGLVIRFEDPAEGSKGAELKANGIEFPAELNVAEDAQVVAILDMIVTGYDPNAALEMPYTVKLPETEFDAASTVRLLLDLGNGEWGEAQPVVVNEDGSLNVTFTADALAQASASSENVAAFVVD
ncbi:MAG: hypothetical protein IJ083_11760 [Clostridia bacterium]|nr:hypothetical protein [Clostridia bacterium]